MRRARFGFARACPDAAEAAALHLPHLPAPPEGIVAAYHARPPELDPVFVLRRLIQWGWRIALPVVVARDAPLVFRLATPGREMVPDAAGLLAPPPGAAEVAPGLIIAPLVAFDAEGGRLGQGGGYYDRTLAALRAGSRPWVIGLAYAGQEADSVPQGPDDQPLDAILTERAYKAFRRG